MVVRLKYRSIHYKLSKNALIMFVGINPHPGSYARGVPFSNNKMFWYLLSKAGIIEEPVEFLKNDKELKKMYENRFAQAYKLNFINLVDRPTVDVSKLKKGEEAHGIERMLGAVKRYRPRLVCFVGKITYQTFHKGASATYGYKDDLFSSKVYLCHFPIRGPASVRIRELKKVIRIAKALDSV